MSQSVDPEARGYVPPGTWVPEDDYDIPPEQPVQEANPPQLNTVKIGSRTYKRVKHLTRFGTYETVVPIDDK